MTKEMEKWIWERRREMAMSQEGGVRETREGERGERSEGAPEGREWQEKRNSVVAKEKEMGLHYWKEKEIFS